MADHFDIFIEVREVSTDIDYERLGDLLETSELLPTPSEAHGMLCGLVAGGHAEPLAAWLEQVLPEADVQGARSGAEPEALCAIGEAGCEAMRDGQLGFTPLMPDDGTALRARATALYDWARGFIFGLGAVGVSESDLSAEAREILHDFCDLTRMDLDDLEEGEENEQALVEVIELVRVAVMLLYAELGSEDGQR